ncbi:MAG: ABC transporter substrate-binding protein [Thermodesulfobacteriota bacterium]
MKKALWYILGLLPALAWPALAEEPVSIGVYLPLSGYLDPAGRSMWEGIQVAHRMRPRVLNRAVVLRVADTKSDKAAAADAVFRLIDGDRVCAIIGELVSGNTIAGSFHAERSGVPMVTPTGSSPLVTQGKRNVFSLSPTDAEYAEQAVALAVHRFSACSVGVVRDLSQESSVGQAACFMRGFSEAGGKVVADIGLRIEDRDLTAQIGHMMHSRPDIIYAPIHYVQCARLARQARAMGLNVPIIAAGALHGPELIELGGRSVENLILTGHVREAVLGTERAARFRDLHMRVTGKPVQPASVLAADAYLLILDAIERAGSSDPRAIRDALHATGDFQGIGGRISMGKDGRAARPVFAVQVRDGKIANLPEQPFGKSPHARTYDDADEQAYAK